MSVADGPRTERAVPLPGPGRVGAWRVGVGPGAVVLQGVLLGEGDGQASATGPVRADGREPPAPGGALAGALVHGPSAAVARPAGPRNDGSPVAVGTPAPFPVRVRGAGPLARRLRAALEGQSPHDVLRPALEVVVHQHVVPPEVGLAAARAGRQTLPVVVQPRRVVIGPVTTSSGPCLHCLDLHRRDRDPHWAFVATHLGHPVEQLSPSPVPESLQVAAEGLVVLLVDTVRSGRPVQAGLSHEVGLQPPHVVLRRWTAHPRCPWHPGPTL